MGLTSTPATEATGVFITAAIWNTEVRDPLTNLQSAWTTYTPTITGSTTNPTLGTGGTITGRYQQIGKTITGWYAVSFGTAGTAPGSGNFTVSLPVAAANPAGPQYAGLAILQDNSAGTEFVRGVRPTGILGAGSTLVSGAGPVPWAASDSIKANFTYESA